MRNEWHLSQHCFQSCHLCMCTFKLTGKFWCSKGDNKIYFYFFQVWNKAIYVRMCFLALVGSKPNFSNDNPWEQWMVMLLKLNWKLNPCYGKWLSLIKIYNFDDSFNWCPFWFNVIICSNELFFLVSVPILNFWNIIHIIIIFIICWCFEYIPSTPFTRPSNVT